MGKADIYLGFANSNTNSQIRIVELVQIGKTEFWCLSGAAQPIPARSVVLSVEMGGQAQPIPHITYVAVRSTFRCN